MIFLVQCWIYKHLLIFSKTTNCIRPTGSCNFVSLWKNFTGAYLFQIALEIMWLSIRIAREWFFITYNIIITQKQTAYHVQNWFTHNLQMLLCFSQKSYVQSKKNDILLCFFMVINFDIRSPDKHSLGSFRSINFILCISFLMHSFIKTKAFHKSISLRYFFLIPIA